MLMTILQANVAPDKWATLEQAFKTESASVSAGLQQTYLIHGITDPTLWRIITIWENREALEQMRGAGTPSGMLMFRAVNAEPTLAIFDVAAHAHRSRADDTPIIEMFGEGG